LSEQGPKARRRRRLGKGEREDDPGSFAQYNTHMRSK
jgi:hypothetical protein